MLNGQTEPRTIAPLFSVIIPLEYHRGQWERCWQGWQSQTLDRDAFEIILVVPPDFAPRDKLSGLEGARLEYSDQSHDIGLSVAGAARARGKFLFFTEAHCWPEPDMLTLCLQAFNENADWAGFSCKTKRVSHNKVSDAEADMYEADIEYGIQVHPWRKVLDQCFVTRREAYEQCGGFKPEFGHFSEWVLAASYFARGYRVGYLREAQINHYYVGSLDELKDFTLDFVAGEIGYFSRNLREPGSDLLEIPPEWICRGNNDRAMAQGILRMLARDVFASRVAAGNWQQTIAALLRWASPAISGDGAARGAAAAVVLHARVMAMLASAIGTRKWLGARFKSYIAALIRYQRLNCIRAERLRKAAAGAGDAVTGSGAAAAILDRTGFYPLEHFQGRAFRWSETAAMIRVRASAVRQSVRIQCAAVRTLSEEIDLRFYFNGRRIPDGAIAIDAEAFEIRIDLPPSGNGELGWICHPFRAKADSRHLGLPVMRLELSSSAGDAGAREVNSAVASGMESV